MAFLDIEIATSAREDKRLIRHFLQRGQDSSASVAVLSRGVTPPSIETLLIKTIVIATLLSTNLLVASFATVPLAPLAGREKRRTPCRTADNRLAGEGLSLERPCRPREGMDKGHRAMRS